MASQLLVNVLNVGPLAGGASVTIAHGLKSNNAGVVPTQILCDEASPIGVASANATTVTFTNTGAIPASAIFRVEYDHSIHAVGATPVYWQGYTPSYAAAGAAVYGSFSDSTDQAFVVGGPLTVKFDTVEGANGVLVANDPVSGRPTRITVAASGVYAFTLSPQILHNGGGTEIITFWAVLNGTNVPRSGSSLEMGNNNNRTLPYIELILPMTAGQYLEWKFTASTGTNVTLEHFPANGSVPAIPSVIAGVKLVGN